jgi:hypothetical protein
MKKLILAILSVPVIFSACKKDDDKNDNDPSKARVLFVHTTLSADTLRVKANGATEVNSLPSLGNSGYISLSPGSTAISFVLTQTSLPLKDTTINLAANNNYSVFAAGTVVSPGVFVTNDDLTSPGSGKAKVRLINLSQENLNETIYVGSTKIDSNVAYRTATPFREVAAGTYNVIVQDPSNVPLLRQISNMQFVGGKIYTIIISGLAAGSGNAALQLTVLSNN